MTNEVLSAELEKLRGGSLEALEAVFLDLRTPVFTVLLRLVRNRELAEDLTQEVFLRLWQTPPGPEIRSPRAWLFRVAHNLALDALRRPGSEELPEQLPQDGFDEGIHCRLDLEAALASLPVRDREIVTLHLNVGLRFREIAEILELPLGTVLWRHSRAITALRERLDGGAI